MKPILLLQLRPIDSACQNEFEAILNYGGLQESDIRRIRMEKEGILSEAGRNGKREILEE